MKRQSLNRMVLDTLTVLPDKQQVESVTARDIKDYIHQAYDIDYPIQTIIVVLNRFMAKGTVNRVTYAGKEVRQRYAYYLNEASQEEMDERLLSRFQALADEFFQGDLQEAFTGLRQLLQQDTESPGPLLSSSNPPSTFLGFQQSRS